MDHLYVLVWTHRKRRHKKILVRCSKMGGKYPAGNRPRLPSECWDRKIHGCSRRPLFLPSVLPSGLTRNGPSSILAPNPSDDDEHPGPACARERGACKKKRDLLSQNSQPNQTSVHAAANILCSPYLR